MAGEAYEYAPYERLGNGMMAVAAHPYIRKSDGARLSEQDLSIEIANMLARLVQRVIRPIEGGAFPDDY